MAPFWRTPAQRRHAELLAWLRLIQAQGVHLMAAVDDLKAVLGRIDTATTNIAADIRVIKDSIKPGMTEAEVAEVQALAEASAARLEALDAENPEGWTCHHSDVRTGTL